MKALERGLAVVELLADHSGGLSFTAIAAESGITNAAASRLLKDLTNLGYAEKADDGRYRPGASLAALTGAGLQERFQRAAEPLLRDLVRETGQSAMAIAWTGNHMVCVARISHEEALPLQTPGNIARNFRDSPWGWFLLQTDWSLHSAKDGSPDADLIARELKRLAKDHYTVHRTALKVRMASPVERDGRVIGALVLGGTSESLPESKEKRCAKRLVEASGSCTELLT